MLVDAKSRDSITAAQSFLLVAPAAASRHFFTNFTRVVHDYLEKPPFNFKNTHKHLGVVKKVIKQTRSLLRNWQTQNARSVSVVTRRPIQSLIPSVIRISVPLIFSCSSCYLFSVYSLEIILVGLSLHIVCMAGFSYWGPGYGSLGGRL